MAHSGGIVRKEHIKLCGNCHEFKPVDCFHISRAEKDGLAWRCKKCAAEYRKEYKKRKGGWGEAHLTEQGPRHKRRTKQQEQAGYLARRAYPKAQHCSNCDRHGGHRHHEDYSEPIDIVWLCPSCHTKYHAGRKKAIHEHNP